VGQQFLVLRVLAPCTHLITITYLMGVALSSDLFLCDFIVNYIHHIFAGKQKFNRLREYCQIQYEN